MGLTSLPTRVSGSVGAAKADATSGVYSNTKLPAGEWNNSAQAVVDVCAEVGLSDGSSSGSLVTKVKEFFRLENGITQFASEDPDYNLGFINPKISMYSSASLPGGALFELRADGVVSPGYNTAIWWFTNSFAFQPMEISFYQSLGAEQIVPALSPGDFMLVGLATIADRNLLTGLYAMSGFVVGDPGGTTWFIKSDGAGAGTLFFTSSVGAYLSHTKLDIFGGKADGVGPNFLMRYNGIDVIDGTSNKLISSGQMGAFTGSWEGSSCADVGIIMLGSFSIPVTMALWDIRVTRRLGDSGRPL